MTESTFTEENFNKLLDHHNAMSLLNQEYKYAVDVMEDRWRQALAAFEVQEGYTDYWRQLYHTTEDEYALYRRQVEKSREP